MSESDHTGSGSSEEMWTCRHCPGHEFTAAEKDAHRRYHETLKAKARRPGPRRSRLPSPPASSVTLFEPVSSKKRPSSPPKSPGGKKTRKVRSTKRFDNKQDVTRRFNSG